MRLQLYQRNHIEVANNKNPTKIRSMIYSNNEKTKLEKIDDYVKNQLSEQQKDELWLELGDDPDLVDRLELEILLKKWAEIYQKIQGQLLLPLRVISSH